MRNLMLLAAGMLLGLSCLSAQPEVGDKPLPLDRDEYLDQSPIDLSALQGAPAVIYFGADWCVPCIEKGRPAVMRIWNKYR